MQHQSTRGKPTLGRNAPPSGQGRHLYAVRPGMSPDQRRALQQLLFDDSEPVRPLSEGLARYAAEYLALGTLSPRTVDWRSLACSRLTDWQERPIDANFRDAALELYRRHGQAAGSHAVNTLGRVLNLARGWGWRHTEHDLRGLSRVRSRQREQVITADDRAALLHALDRVAEQSPRRATACDVARVILVTGMRVGEATAIEWGHVAMADRYVLLPKTKGKRPRMVPLCTTALEVLARRPRGRYVFPRFDGAKPIDDASVVQALDLACSEAAIARVTPHVLRHTWATEAMRAGVVDTVAAKALGHSSVIELRRYQHARIDDVREAMDLVEQRLVGKRAVS